MILQSPEWGKLAALVDSLDLEEGLTAWQDIQEAAEEREAAIQEDIDAQDED